MTSSLLLWPGPYIITLFCDWLGALQCRVAWQTGLGGSALQDGGSEADVSRNTQHDMIFYGICKALNLCLHLQHYEDCTKCFNQWQYHYDHFFSCFQHISWHQCSNTSSNMDAVSSPAVAWAIHHHLVLWLAESPAVKSGMANRARRKWSWYLGVCSKYHNILQTLQATQFVWSMISGHHKIGEILLSHDFVAHQQYFPWHATCCDNEQCLVLLSWCF